ncbi:MAG: DUF928 domain-containing protein [Leptolyngbyaceae cyanobacterium bins.349]|nr:DUF928 domain-containing protein [Leptolyngbyaceae cyanobacterium bins.349]
MGGNSGSDRCFNLLSTCPRPMKYSTKLAFLLLGLIVLPPLNLGIPVQPLAASPVATAKGLTAQTNTIAPRNRRRLNWRVGVRSSRYRVGAFSRSGSCATPAQMVPFTPPARAEERVGSFRTPVDLTLSSRPTFWVYVSSIPPNTEMQFTLQDAIGKEELYSTTFTVNQADGLIGIRLPKTAPELAVGESYVWELSMNCADRNNPVNLLSTSGWVQRVNPQQMRPTATFDPRPLVQELAKAADLDKPALYAGLGIWQDAVTTLIELRQKQPNNRELKEDWRNLLIGAQMDQFVDAPVLAVN